MTEYELVSLVFVLFRGMDAQIQFWLQATFATVVAVFFAGDRLSAGFRRLTSPPFIWPLPPSLSCAGS